MNFDYIKCGDCLELIKEIPDKSVNIVLTSPPYNMTKRKGGVSDTGRYDSYVDWKPENEYIDWLVDVFNSFDRILANNGVILFNFSYSIENPSLPYKLMAKVVEKTNFDIVDTICWKKANGIPFPANRCRLSRIFEFVFVLARKDETNTFITNRKVKSTNEAGQDYYEVQYNYIEAKNNDEKCDLNQATFSTEFVTKLLNMYSPNKTDVILDCFMGTGTTPVGCIESCRHYIGFEISESQFKLASERIDKHKAQERWF